MDYGAFRTDYEFLQALGKGSYATVWKARHIATSLLFAIKEIKKKILKNPVIKEHVETQLYIMQQLKHSNIISLHHHFEDEVSLYFVLEYAGKGELYRQMLRMPNQCFPEQQAAQYIYEVLQALQYIHSQNVIHRDIKPENILLTDSNSIRLADFGWSNFGNGKQRQTYCGTLDYLAPEMIAEDHSHDYRVDIWSIGVLIYQLCLGYGPFSHQAAIRLTEDQIKNNIVKVAYGGEENLSASCRDLIRKILVRSPEKRLPIAEILTHEWITQYGNPHKKREQKGIQNYTMEKKMRELELQVKEQELLLKKKDLQLLELKTLREKQSENEKEIMGLRRDMESQRAKIEALYAQIRSRDKYIQQLL